MDYGYIGFVDNLSSTIVKYTQILKSLYLAYIYPKIYIPIMRTNFIWQKYQLVHYEYNMYL